MGMKYCKRKIPRLRKFLLKVVFSFPVIRENQDKMRKRNVECGEIQLHYICLGQIFELEIFKKVYKHYLQELIVHYSCVSWCFP